LPYFLSALTQRAIAIQIEFLVFPRVQQLDMTGPYDAFASLPDVAINRIWKDLAPLKASSGMTLTPDATFGNCPKQIRQHPFLRISHDSFWGKDHWEFS
jgi:transcriptional regulator GlxA family with amidase domain